MKHPSAGSVSESEVRTLFRRVLLGNLSKLGSRSREFLQEIYLAKYVLRRCSFEQLRELKAPNSAKGALLFRLRLPCSYK